MKSNRLLAWIAALLIALSSQITLANPGHPHKGHHKPVKHLPAGAVGVVISGVNYWLAGDIYYKKKGKSYVVVTVPVGAKVRVLPEGAVVVKRHGQQLFFHSGIYYRWMPKAKKYEVVALKTLESSRYTTGQVLTYLPDGARAVLINGVQYFRYSGRYLMPTERNGKDVYVVVEL